MYDFHCFLLSLHLFVTLYFYWLFSLTCSRLMLRKKKSKLPKSHYSNSCEIPVFMLNSVHFQFSHFHFLIFTIFVVLLSRWRFGRSKNITRWEKWISCFLKNIFCHSFTNKQSRYIMTSYLNYTQYQGRIQKFWKFWGRSMSATMVGWRKNFRFQIV